MEVSCEKSHYTDYIALKICLWHNFEMAVITMNALSGYSKVLMIFNERYVA